jgi:hypothetical protein
MFLPLQSVAMTDRRERKKQGRPPKADGVGKTVLMQVRLSPIEKAAFVAAAQVSGEELSVWVRQRLRRAARNEMKAAGRGDPFSTTQDGTPPA